MIDIPVIKGDLDKVFDTLEKADKKKPTKKVREELQTVLEENPGVWRYMGDLARLTQEKLIENTKGTYGVRESLRAGLESIQSDLGYEDSGPLERLLIQQVAIAWLDYYKTLWYHESNLESGVSLRIAAYWGKRLNGAHRRYMRAINTLARVRKMGPCVQINIASEQVNQVVL